MTSLKELKQEIEKIKERNRRVESDKTWEISNTRRVLLVFFTYLAVGFYLQVINVPQPWLNAIVPAVAFTLSTLTLPFFKKLWLKYIHK
jgi:sterol desaturase/sphingolipid hydroxylase (fatty acid hydroxylase superfamily)